jgi:acetyl esterase
MSHDARRVSHGEGGVQRPRFRLIAGARGGDPATEALRVIEQLMHRGPKPSSDLADVRRRYTESRRPLLTPLEPVESIVHVRPSASGIPPLSIIRPAAYTSGELRPCLVYLHGGGWTVGDFETYEPLCRQLANALGAVVVFVHYRLAPEHPFPAAYDDAQQAFHWVGRNHAWLGVDPERIAIGGDSSGGNLAAAAALAMREHGVRLWAQILLYPALDMTACMASHKTFAQGYLLTAELYAWYRRNYAQGHEKPGHWRLSPLFAHDVAGLPPSVVLHSGFDPLRDEAIAYAERLRQAGVPTETLSFPDMIHGFLTMGGAIPAAEVAIRRVAVALQLLTEPAQ